MKTIKDFVKTNKENLKILAKMITATAVISGGIGYGILSEKEKPSMRDLLPEPTENQKLMVDEKYMKDFGGLKYILYTDRNENGIFDYYKSVWVGNTPGAYNVEYGSRKDIKN